MTPEYWAALPIAAFVALCVLCALVDHFRPKQQPIHTRRASSNRKAGQVRTW